MASRLVKIDDLGPGLKLAKDVVDSKGTLLFKAGVELSAPMIERIRARNISHAFVEDIGGPGLSEADIAAQQSTMDVEMDALFADVAEQPLMAALRDSAKKYLKAKLGG